MKDKNLKLKIKMIPYNCQDNLRTILSQKKWDIIRKATYRRARGKCEICGTTKRILHAHEDWKWDKSTGYQILKNVKCVCDLCHSVIHYKFTESSGKGKEARKHFMKINNCSAEVFKEHLRKAEYKCELRGNRNWGLDVSLVINKKGKVKLRWQM